MNIFYKRVYTVEVETNKKNLLVTTEGCLRYGEPKSNYENSFSFYEFKNMREEKILECFKYDIGIRNKYNFLGLGNKVIDELLIVYSKELSISKKYVKSINLKIEYVKVDNVEQINSFLEIMNNIPAEDGVKYLKDKNLYLPLDK